jgi:hypothetical protein
MRRIDVLTAALLFAAYITDLETANSAAVTPLVLASSSTGLRAACCHDAGTDTLTCAASLTMLL